MAEDSGCHCLAFLDAVGAGVGAGFALGVFLFVFPAFFFAGGADVGGDLGHGRGELGALQGQLHQGVAGGQQFADGLGTGSHFLVALAQQHQTVGEAGFAGLLTVAAAVDQGGVAFAAHGAVVVVVMLVVLGGGGRGGGHGGGYGAGDGFQYFTSLH